MDDIANASAHERGLIYAANGQRFPEMAGCNDIMPKKHDVMTKKHDVMKKKHDVMFFFNVPGAQRQF